ncbi:hypothetical protein F503_06870 [Ophiostoma piceae UAMH 11346]|uniref:Ankyrin repeat protein n=1 Tax=Ophiostoma piceae (strain UAMH 11346) TaxID=1262450 RepID=S3C6C6_OPHP1|nr:hypothetical protein F503_06870 [Ophiostoma piceae UAMH 11346]
MFGKWWKSNDQPQQQHIEIQQQQPHHYPNLYPVRNTSIELYFRRLLDHDITLKPPVHDMVAAAIHSAKTDPATTMPPSDCLIPILTRCITSTYELVRYADEYMAEEGCPSCLAGQGSFKLLQILVAIALKHRNLDLLRHLVQIQPTPPNTMFTVSNTFETFAPVLDDPNYGAAAWSVLVDAGWAHPLAIDKNDPRYDILLPRIPKSPSLPTLTKSWDDMDVCYDAIEAAVLQGDCDHAVAVLDGLVARGFTPDPYTARLLRLLVSQSWGNMVLRFLALVPRTGNAGCDGLPPRPVWPGDEFLVALAASGPEPRHTHILQVLVEYGGMNIYTHSGVWYKDGPNDEHPMSLSGDIRFRRLPDRSCADNPPLVAAVHAGNVDSVEYILRKGGGDSNSNNILGQALERAKDVKEKPTSTQDEMQAQPGFGQPLLLNPISIFRIQYQASRRKL